MRLTAQTTFPKAEPLAVRLSCASQIDVRAVEKPTAPLASMAQAEGALTRNGLPVNCALATDRETGKHLLDMPGSCHLPLCSYRVLLYNAHHLVVARNDHKLGEV